ncbi:MAG: hypothetical protein RLT05_04410, partial [Bauldia litoralis]
MRTAAGPWHSPGAGGGIRDRSPAPDFGAPIVFWEADAETGFRAVAAPTARQERLGSETMHLFNTITV